MNFRATIYLRVFRTVLKGISSVKKSHAVDVLNITLLEVQPEREFLCCVMQGIQGFCLSLWNRRNVCATLLFAITSEVATRILDDNVAILIIKQGPLGVARVTAKTGKTRCNLESAPMRLVWPTYQEATQQQEYGWGRAGLPQVHYILSVHYWFLMYRPLLHCPGQTMR